MRDDLAEVQRQQRMIMIVLGQLEPGSVCLDTSCPTGQRVPHMTLDNADHPILGSVAPRQRKWVQDRRRKWRLDQMRR